ncbi:hypothetical protein L484_005357 [Morus notabilis]|uniref:Uncharacterized protein n=1 Tax=Morus notabilis TaxID=981085 RepID=W9SJL9_9ROSA|nr:hypothetical protein L484_005357 [Morus notabilis]
MIVEQDFILQANTRKAKARIPSQTGINIRHTSWPSTAANSASLLKCSSKPVKTIPICRRKISSSPKHFLVLLSFRFLPGGCLLDVRCVEALRLCISHVVPHPLVLQASLESLYDVVRDQPHADALRVICRQNLSIESRLKLLEPDLAVLSFGGGVESTSLVSAPPRMRNLILSLFSFPSPTIVPHHCSERSGVHPVGIIAISNQVIHMNRTDTYSYSHAVPALWELLLKYKNYCWPTS